MCNRVANRFNKSWALEKPKLQNFPSSLFSTSTTAELNPQCPQSWVDKSSPASKFELL